MPRVAEAANVALRYGRTSMLSMSTKPAPPGSSVVDEATKTRPGAAFAQDRRLVRFGLTFRYSLPADCSENRVSRARSLLRASCGEGPSYCVHDRAAEARF